MWRNSYVSSFISMIHLIATKNCKDAKPLKTQRNSSFDRNVFKLKTQLSSRGVSAGKAGRATAPPIFWDIFWEFGYRQFSAVAT